MNVRSCDRRAGVAGILLASVFLLSVATLARAGGVGSAAMSLLKSSTTPSFDAPGETINYSYLVTNTGGDTLTSIAVNDNLIDLANILCPVTTLDPGAKMTCTAAYTTAQADVDTGSVTNIAIASALNSQSGTVNSQASTVTVNATQTPAISLTKSSITPNYSAPGQAIAYSYLVGNSGNVTLNQIVINDNEIVSANILCVNTTVAPSTSTTCTASYIATQADVDNGSVTNVATASALDPQGTQTTSGSSSVTVPAILNPGISLTKSSPTPSFSAAGQTIAYSYLVSNSGNDTLNFIAVNDNKITSAITCLATTLAPNLSTTCTASYTVSQGDVDNGSVTNVASASAQNPQGSAVTSSQSSVTVDAVVSPSLSLTESVLPTSVSSAGQTLTYSYTATNTGDVTLSNLSIADTQTAPSSNTSLSMIVCPLPVLAPGASTICTATYTVTAADITHASIANMAVASATSPQSFPVTSNTATLVVSGTATAPKAAVAVPTLAQWMLLLLATLLVATGVRLATRARLTPRQ